MNTVNETDFSQLTRRVGGKSADAWAVHREGERRRQGGQDVLMLSIGEDTNAQTASFIVEEGVRALRAGQHHYTDLRGIATLREAIAAQHQSATGQPTHLDQCAVFSGAQNALFAVSLTIAEAGDEIVIVEPYYSTYPATFSAGGARVVPVTAQAENRFQPTIDDLSRAVTTKTKAIVLNSPNNPTGAIYDQQLNADVLALCKAHDLWLVSDEVYAEFVYAGTHTSPASLTPTESKCVIVSSVSKSYAMSGWRVGWVIGPVTLCDQLENLQLCMSYGLPPFIQTAATTAIKNGKDTVGAIVAGYAKKANLVCGRLETAPGIRFNAPQSGMFVVLDVSSVAPSGHEFANRLLDEHNICLLPCDGFGDNMIQFVRMSLCASPSQLTRACDAIVKMCTERSAS